MIMNDNYFLILINITISYITNITINLIKIEARVLLNILN